MKTTLVISTRYTRLPIQSLTFIHLTGPTMRWAYFLEHPNVDLIIANEASGGLVLVKAIRLKKPTHNIRIDITATSVNADLVEQANALGVTNLYNATTNVATTKMHLAHYQLRRYYRSSTGLPVTYDGFTFRTPWWKRLIDILVAATVLALLSPLLLIVALLIRLESPGPIFYKSKRAGSQFRIFSMHKFRTMQVNADKLVAGMKDQNLYQPTTESSAHSCNSCQLNQEGCQHPLFIGHEQICERAYLNGQKSTATFMKFSNDPRITRLGRFLRNSSVDELPQLINVLKGDMSLVGNRPLPLYEAEKLTTDEFVKRFAGPAGLTGLWQVTKRAKGHETMSEQERIALDIRYAESFSFLLDFKILYRTIFTFWQKETV